MFKIGLPWPTLLDYINCIMYWKVFSYWELSLFIYINRKSNPGLFYFFVILPSWYFIIQSDCGPWTSFFCYAYFISPRYKNILSITAICTWFTDSCSLALFLSQLPHFANQKSFMSFKPSLYMKYFQKVVDHACKFVSEVLWPYVFLAYN